MATKWLKFYIVNLKANYKCPMKKQLDQSVLTIACKGNMKKLYTFQNECD